MRRYSSALVSPGADSGILAWPIPNESSFNYMQGEIHLIGTVALALANAVMYAVEGWLLKSDTPADFENLDTLWDKFVPKDDDLIDLDASAAADTSTMFEPGQISVSQVFEQEIGGPHRFFKKNKMLSLANAPFAFIQATATWHPTDHFPISMSANLKVREDSGAIVGLGNPLTTGFGPDDDVVEDVLGTSMDSFEILKNMERLISFAMIEATAFTEMGAESPFEDIANFLINTLEKVDEDGSSTFASATYHVFAKGMAGISTPKGMLHRSIGPDAQA